MAFLTVASVGPSPLWMGLLVVLSVLFSLASVAALNTLSRDRSAGPDRTGVLCQAQVG